MSTSFDGSVKRSPSYEEFLNNKSSLVRSLKKKEKASRLIKFGPASNTIQNKQWTPYKPRLKLPRDVENEISPYNITQSLRLNSLKNDIKKLPTYLRPTINNLFFYRYQDRIYVPETDEPVGLPELGEFKTLEERERKKNPFVYKEGQGTQINDEEQKGYYVLPSWAEKKMQHLREQPSGYFDLENNDYQHQLSKFTNKEQIKTVIAMGMDRILHWMKVHDALLRLEAGDRVRETLKAEGKWRETEEFEPPPLPVAIEEKEALMELILRLSEQLMVLDIFWNSGCPTKLSARKLKQRTRLPLISDGSGIKRSHGETQIFRYTLPYWAFDVLNKVMSMKQIQTTDEEATACLMPFLKIRKLSRKYEVERKMEKKKKKIMKYLKVMKTLLEEFKPPPVTDLENLTQEFKTKMFLRMCAESRQILHFPGIDIEDDATGELGQQRLKEKINLEEKILRMDFKLRLFDNFLKTTKQIISSKKRNPVPKYEMPAAKTDQYPECYSAIEGRPIVPLKFKKNEYVNKVKKIFMKNLIKGVEDDVAAQKEEQRLRLIDYLFKVLDDINYFTETFNVFLFENQEDVMVNMRSYIEVGLVIFNREQEIKDAQKIHRLLKSALLPLGGLLKFRRMCQTLLYDLAPHHWKCEYDKEKEKLQPLADKAADDVLSHFAFFLTNSYVFHPFLLKLALFLADTIRNLGPPANYFKSAFEIDLAIRQLELENLHALITTVMVLKHRESLMDAKEKLEERSRKEINSLSTLLTEMMDKLKPKVEHIKEMDKRSEQVAYHYWKTVSTNDSILCAITHIKSLYNEFIGQHVHQTEDPVEMLMAVADDIIATQIEVLNIPSADRQAIFTFIKQKEKAYEDRGEHAKRLQIETEKLLNNMKRSFGISVGQQGHPPRFRSKTVEDPKDKDFAKGKPATPISRRIMKRILNLYEPTKQDDAILDTLQAFEEMRKAERHRRFFPGIRFISKNRGSDFSDEESSVGFIPHHAESSDESLKSQHMGDLEKSVFDHLEAMPKVESTTTLSSIVPSITEDSLSEQSQSAPDNELIE